MSRNYSRACWRGSPTARVPAKGIYIRCNGSRGASAMTQRVRFGLNADPNISGVAIAERITAIADSHGLELVGMQDHPYNDGFLDTFTLLTWLASKTASVHFLTNVPNLPLRPPVMLAKQAATMDVLSGGRFELGLGAGAFWEGIAG